MLKAKPFLVRCALVDRADERRVGVLQARVLEHRLREVIAAVVDVEGASPQERGERAVPAAEIDEAETAGLPVGDAQQLLEAKLLRLGRVPVDAARSRAV